MAKTFKGYGDGKTILATIDPTSLKDMPSSKWLVADMKDTGPVTITGFWGPEDAVCAVCQRAVHRNEPMATMTTDTDPAEYLGMVCRDCCLKALETVT